MSSALERKEVIAGGIRLQYIERPADGPSAKKPLLLIHGLLATAETQAELIALLPADRRIVALDLLSATPVDRSHTLPVHFDSLAALVTEFAEALGIHDPVLIGHSHGGVLSLNIATFHRMPVSGLVLLCPAHPFEGYRAHVVAFYLKPLGRQLALCIPFAPAWAILGAYNDAAGPGKPITYKHLGHYMRVLRKRKTLKRVLEMLKTWEEDMDTMRASMQQTAIPQSTLLIWGDADPVVPISSAAALEQHLAASERITLPGKGHLLAEEAPQELAQHITAWLSLRA